MTKLTTSGGEPRSLDETGLSPILRQFDSEYDAQLPPMHVVFGAYEGDIDGGSPTRDRRARAAGHRPLPAATADPERGG